jgi:hypothetical protein
MNAIQYIKKNGLKKAMAVVEAAPSNAESFQDGYYFRTKPEFQFHNGFHPIWNLTDNDGEWFKKDGFDPVLINDLKMLLESIRLVDQFGGLDKAKLLINTKKGMGYLKQAIADYEQLFGNTETLGGEHV